MKDLWIVKNASQGIGVENLLIAPKNCYTCYFQIKFVDQRLVSHLGQVQDFSARRSCQYYTYEMFWKRNSQSIPATLHSIFSTSAF